MGGKVRKQTKAKEDSKAAMATEDSQLKVLNQSEFLTDLVQGFSCLQWCTKLCPPLPSLAPLPRGVVGISCALDMLCDVMMSLKGEHRLLQQWLGYFAPSTFAGPPAARTSPCFLAWEMRGRCIGFCRQPRLQNLVHAKRPATAAQAISPSCSGKSFHWLLDLAKSPQRGHVSKRQLLPQSGKQLDSTRLCPHPNQHPWQALSHATGQKCHCSHHPSSNCFLRRNRGNS